MPTLKITMTVSLPDTELAAFRDRHEIEGHVLAMCEQLDGEDIDLSIAITIDDSTPPAKRGRPPGPRKAPNGDAAVETGA